MDEYLAGLLRDRDLLVDGRAWPNYMQASAPRFTCADQCHATKQGLQNAIWRG
jgi:hypothetical protein